MKAAQLKEIGKISISQIRRPKCGPGEVLVKTMACGICRTDMKCLVQGQRDLQLPRVLGHEIAGVIAQVGRGVTGLRPGDRVHVSPGIPCGTCTHCLSGRDNLCVDMRILGFHLDGGFADYILIPSIGVKCGVLQPLPDSLSFAEAALTEPLACAVNMQHALNVPECGSVLIIGAGPLGILNARLARARGAGKILLAERDAGRLKRAQNLDVDLLIDAGKSDLVKVVMDVMGGSGMDAVIPCCPGTEPFLQGITTAAKGGRLGFFSGLISGEEDVSAGSLIKSLSEIHYKALTVTGTYGCTIANCKEALGLINNGSVAVSDMITSRIELDDLSMGIEMVRRMSETSIVVEF